MSMDKFYKCWDATFDAPEYYGCHDTAKAEDWRLIKIAVAYGLACAAVGFLAGLGAS